MGTKEKVLSPLRVGNAVLIRTVTMYQIGMVEEIGEHEVVLSDAAWIPDVGRFATALKTGLLSEVEPFVGPVAVGRGAIVDVAEWNHPLPREQK